MCFGSMGQINNPKPFTLAVQGEADQPESPGLWGQWLGSQAAPEVTADYK